VEGAHAPGSTVPLQPYELLLAKAVRIMGITGWNASCFSRAVELIERKAIAIEPLVTQVLPLAEWETAFDFAISRKDESIKVQLQMQDKA
jgi:threonine dehydrogenase-like Zn-dependent dehydrogenase